MEASSFRQKVLAILPPRQKRGKESTEQGKRSDPCTHPLPCDLLGSPLPPVFSSRTEVLLD